MDTNDDTDSEGSIDSNEYLEEDGSDNEMPSAEPGLEGISVWDLLGEGFLKEASRLGVSTRVLRNTL
jgi:hypothetical protein